MMNWLPLDTCISITVSTGTVAPAGGLVPMHVAGRAGAVDGGLTELAEAVDREILLRDVGGLPGDVGDLLGRRTRADDHGDLVGDRRRLVGRRVGADDACLSSPVSTAS